MKNKFKRTGKYYVYIVKCQNRTYYVGYTNILEKRIKEHNGNTRGAKYTRSKGPVKLVWCKEYGYLKSAMKKEAEIKKLRRYQKQKLVNEGGMAPNPKRLKSTPNSKRRTPNPKRPKNLLRHFSGQDSVCQPKVYIKTFGCQMNSRDTEIIYSQLIERGYSVARNIDEADVVLFNTCSVREHAEERVWSQIGMLKKLKANKGPSTSLRTNQPIVGLVGCMAQSYKERIFERLPHVNLVCGTGNIYEIGNCIDKLVKTEKDKVLAVDKEQRPESLDGKCNTYRKSALKAYVSIMEGCDNFCSYCIVPYVRGRERSRELNNILAEVRMLADRGFKEVTLLGQNVNSYSGYRGHKTESRKQKNYFVRLLEDINKIKGIERVRFTTSHPKDVSEDLFRAMRDLPHICEHLHLPLQSGSDRILRSMHRGYRALDYLKLVEKFRKILPQSSITTDIIVGFPRETREDFDKTRRTLEKIEFDSAFIFKYSPRPPAGASKLKDSVSRGEKEERNQILLELQGRISRAKNQRLVGGVKEVLVEGRSKKASSQLIGRTRTNKITVFEGEKTLVGKLVKVKIEKVTPHTLIGAINGKN